MESPEEAAVASRCCNSSSGGDDSRSGGDGLLDFQHAVASAAIRRRRTKRLLHPNRPGSTSPRGVGTVEEYYYSSDQDTAAEEEDTAHCLILLAQRVVRRGAHCDDDHREGKFVSRRSAEAATTAGGGKAGYYVYECKTCNRCFPSFQALGGHRASHKKPKLADDHADTPDAFARPPAHAAALGGRLRVHECSICGLEFASGQALGGHMRRHRLVGTAATATAAPGPAEEAVKKEPKNVLSLDLNLPAPPEESGNPMPVGFGFTYRRPVALVDCHY